MTLPKRPKLVEELGKIDISVLTAHICSKIAKTKGNSDYVPTAWSEYILSLCFPGNIHGPMCVFTHSKQPLERYEAPLYFPPVEMNHALLTKTFRSEWDVPIEKLRKGLMKGQLFQPGERKNYLYLRLSEKKEHSSHSVVVLYLKIQAAWILRYKTTTEWLECSLFLWKT